MEKREPSYIVGGNANWLATVENSMEALQNTKENYYMIQNPSPE